MRRKIHAAAGIGNVPRDHGEIILPRKPELRKQIGRKALAAALGQKLLLVDGEGLKAEL